MQAFNANVCSVTLLMHQDILDFKSVSAFPEFKEILTDKCFHKGKKVRWSEIKHVMFTKETPNQMFFKYKLEVDYKSVVIRNEIPTTRFKQPVNKRKYDGPVGISTKKKADLMKMCSKSLIPKQHHAFYESLAMISNEEATEEDVVFC